MAMFLPSNALHSLTFRKTGADLVTAIERKIVELSASVEIRKGRIVALRREEKIDDRLWAALLEAERTASRSANYYSISVADAGREAEPGQTEIRIRAGGTSARSRAFTTPSRTSRTRPRRRRKSPRRRRTPRTGRRRGGARCGRRGYRRRSGGARASRSPNESKGWSWRFSSVGLSFFPPIIRGPESLTAIVRIGQKLDPGFPEVGEESRERRRLIPFPTGGEFEFENEAEERFEL